MTDADHARIDALLAEIDAACPQWALDLARLDPWPWVPECDEPQQLNLFD